MAGRYNLGMEIVPFHGWNRNARLVCRDVEMVVTLEVGPRILGYGFVGGDNELMVKPATEGMVGGDEFRSYGGHRLWIAPEEAPRTFQPDNGPVDYQVDGDWHVFTAAPDRFHIQKQFRIRANEDTGAFHLVHRITNLGAYDVELGPWTPTQFAPGGVCIFPQAPRIEHAAKVLPARPMVLWHYTDMTDPRFTWGRRVVRLKTADLPSTKIGAWVQQGYAVYANRGNTYLRRFECVEGATYPDYGCNFEAYTREDMLEVESMSPMQTVPKKGGFTDHLETWYLLRGATPPEDDDACGDWLEEIVSTRPL